MRANAPSARMNARSSNNYKAAYIVTASTIDNKNTSEMSK